ncbi:MAG: LCP family protein [Agathobacter sp.]|nr:LCP family protein [Agathobacter sp.]
MSNMKEAVGKRNLYILLILLLLVLIVVVVVTVTAKQQTGNVADSTSASSQSEEETEKWQEGVIQYNNKGYQYNNQLKIYLLMGVDTELTVNESINSKEDPGQSDAMFLLVADPQTMQMSVISINRNTMTRIEAFSESGGSVGYYNMQLCLQYAYGDGANLSCARTVEAVSYLFYNLPINGYLSVNMGAIPKINDAVGGVEVEILEDMEGDGITLTKGERVLLDGQQAYLYLRGRDVDQFDSSTDRLRRQEQYISNYLEKMNQAPAMDAQNGINVYNSISDYIVTNMDAAQVITELMEYDFDSSRMYTVPGETKMGETFEEFSVDNEEFYKIILDVFYKEVVS